MGSGDGVHGEAVWDRDLVRGSMEWRASLGMTWYENEASASGTAKIFLV